MKLLSKLKHWFIYKFKPYPETSKPELKEGDIITVNFCKRASHKGFKRIYLFTDKFGRLICVRGRHEEDYKKGEQYDTVVWDYRVVSCKELNQ